MKTLHDVIKKAKKESGKSTSYALALSLGLNKSRVAAWESGERHPRTVEAMKLAEAAKLDPLEVLAIIEAQTAKKPEDREYWKRFLALSRRSIGAALLVITAGLCSVAGVSLFGMRRRYA